MCYNPLNNYTYLTLLQKASFYCLILKDYFICHLPYFPQIENMIYLPSGAFYHSLLHPLLRF